MQAGIDPSDPAWVKAQAAKLFPNARVLSHDWHDWVDDPFARGTWVAAFAGHEEGLSAANWQPEGAIAFASSDYAREQAGWFEGCRDRGRGCGGGRAGLHVKSWPNTCVEVLAPQTTTPTRSSFSGL